MRAVSDSRPIRIGIAGLGAAGQAFIAPIQAHPGCEWVALAEPVADTRERIAPQHGVAAYASLPELLAHDGLDAVYLATPTPMHAAQVAQAAAAGKHVLVEKPMATTLEEGRTMIEACQRAGVVLLVGHSHSYDGPIHAMRALIDSGELGRVGMVNTWCYTDWMQRPRRPEELDVALGGGVTFRQGAHQFDILRLLCGGLATRVKAKTFDWNPQRRSVGAHTVFIDFDNGASATAVYNGYGRFASMDLGFDISEWGFHQPPGQRPRPSRPAAGLSPEAALAQALRDKQQRAGSAIPAQAPYQPFFGLTVVSCERGDIRQSPDGLLVYTDEGQREITLPKHLSPRDRVMAEFHDAITGRAAALHDGRWGLANLELCVAAMASSCSGCEVALQEQVALPTPQAALPPT